MTEPQTYDEAVQQVHRAFCDPDHELVGEWDREMAEALERNGYAIIEAGAGRAVQDGLDPERLALAMGGAQAHHSKDNPALGEHTRRDWTEEWNKRLRHARQVAAEYDRLAAPPLHDPVRLSE